MPVNANPLASAEMSARAADLRVCGVALMLASLPAGLLSIGGAASASAANTVKSLPASARVRFDEQRKTISAIEGEDLLASRPQRSERDPAAQAIEFISAHREVFRLKNPAEELKVSAVNRDELGFHHVRLAQVFGGLDVAHCQLIVHFRANGALYLINGSYIPTPAALDLRPKLSAAAAVRAIAAELTAEPADWPAALKIWPARNGAGLLAYEVAASIAPDRAWRVFVDAHSGKILDRISAVYTADPKSPP